MNSIHEQFIRSLIDWLFRRRSAGLISMRIGLALFILAFGAGWALDFSFPFRDGSIDLNFDSSGGAPIVIIYIAAFIGVLLLLGGFFFELHRYFADQKQLSRKKVIVIEVQGLREGAGCTLSSSLPGTLQGRLDPMLIDLRQSVVDGEIVKPTAALEEIISLPVDLRRREKELDRDDIALVYGGLAPVPFSFLTGVLIDDERSVHILDWDRHKTTWRELDAVDDGRRFNSIKSYPKSGSWTDIALVISVSYQIKIEDVSSVLDDIPIHELILEECSPDSHWSEEKQCALGKQFFETVAGFLTLGVNRIHLFLSAPNSVVFRFGRLYDKRNFPEILVYQYVRGSTPTYPWCIRMPVASVEKPEVLYSGSA
ncbi:MAG: SAVED domain-containing protein [Gammaproteobacteria bacterium]|nr:SAVED domain-containing protein [Gammaproteobacteria bacterium]